MAEHQDERTADDTGIEPVMRRERRETLPPQARHTHDDLPRADGEARNRWRFSSAVEAARHLGSSR